MGKKSKSDKYNSYACFEKSILDLAKKELKNSSITESGETKLGGGLFGGPGVIGGAIGAVIGGPYGAIGGITGAAAGAVTGGIIGYTQFGLTDKLYSSDLEKRYRDYIKANYENEFKEHINDKPYIQSLILRAVKAVKELMSTPLPTHDATVASCAMASFFSDSDDNDKNE